MAKDNIIGIAMELDVSDLKSGLAETRKAITTANKQFQASTAGMDNWKESIAGVDAKLQQLDTVLKNQKKNLAGYEAELGRVTEEYGENSEQARRLKDKILDCQTAIAKTEKQQRNYASTLDKLQGEHIETVTDVGKLEDAIRDLGTILTRQKKSVSDYESALERAKSEHGETSQEVKDLTKKLNDAKSAVEKTEKAQKDYTSQLNKVQSETTETSTDTKKLTKAMDDANSATIDLKGGFTVLKGAMANLASTAVTSLVSGLQNIVSESREFRSEMSYLQATANDTGASFDQAKEKVKQVYATLGETDSAVEGMNNLMTAGFNGETLDKITDQLVGASIKWHDTLKFEGLADGLQETLATGAAIGPFAELLERAGVNLETFDEGLAGCTTEAEKQNYVLKTLGKLGLAEVAEGYRKTNKSLVEGAEAQFEYEQAMADVGAKAEPVLTTVKQGWVDVLNACLDSSDGISTADLQGKIKEGFQWFIDECIPRIKEGLVWVVDNINILAPLVGGMAALWAGWKVGSIISDVVGGIKTAVEWTKKLELATKAHTIAEKARTVATKIGTIAQKALNLVLKMNPIGLVIIAITALIAIFVTLWKKCDWFREFWINLWEKIKDVAKVVWEAITGFFQKAWDVIQQTWSVVVEWFSKIWNGIKNAFSKVGSYFKERFTKAWQNIKQAWSSVTKWFSNVWKSIKQTFSNVASTLGGFFKSAWNAIKNAWSGVVNWFKGIWNGIKSAFSSVSSTLSGFFKSAWTAIKNAWSGVTSWFGNIWSKIKSTFSKVGSTLGGYFRSAWTAVKNAWSGVGSWASGIVSKIIGFFKGLPGKMLSIGKDMMNGLIDGVKSMVSSVKKAVTNAVDSAVEGVKDFLGIKSPSRLMRDEVGKMMGLGVGEGILASTKNVLKDATRFSSQIADGLASKVSDINVGLNTATGTIGGVAQPTQTVTNVTNHYEQIINAPKQPSRIELYRQSKNLLSLKGGY